MLTSAMRLLTHGALEHLLKEILVVGLQKFPDDVRVLLDLRGERGETAMEFVRRADMNAFTTNHFLHDLSEQTDLSHQTLDDPSVILAERHIPIWESVGNVSEEEFDPLSFNSDNGTKAIVQVSTSHVFLLFKELPIG